MVVHLLALGRHRAEQRTAGIDQILSLEIFLLIHQEILLLRPYGRDHPLYGRVSKQMEDPHRLLVDGFQRLAPVGAERRGDA